MAARKSTTTAETTDAKVETTDAKVDDTDAKVETTDAATDDQPRNADGTVIEPPADDEPKTDDGPDPEPSKVDTIPAVEHSAPAVENAEAIAEQASPNGVTEEDGVAAFRPPQTRHTPWTINTLAESEGGSAHGIEQTSGNADVTKDPADRTDGDAD